MSHSPDGVRARELYDEDAAQWLAKLSPAHQDEEREGDFEMQVLRDAALKYMQDRVGTDIHVFTRQYGAEQRIARHKARLERDKAAAAQSRARRVAVARAAEEARYDALYWEDVLRHRSTLSQEERQVEEDGDYEHKERAVATAKYQQLSEQYQSGELNKLDISLGAFMRNHGNRERVMRKLKRRYLAEEAALDAAAASAASAASAAPTLYPDEAAADAEDEKREDEEAEAKRMRAIRRYTVLGDGSKPRHRKHDEDEDYTEEEEQHRAKKAYTAPAAAAGRPTRGAVARAAAAMDGLSLSPKELQALYDDASRIRK